MECVRMQGLRNTDDNFDPPIYQLTSRKGNFLQVESPDWAYGIGQLSSRHKGWVEFKNSKKMLTVWPVHASGT